MRVLIIHYVRFLCVCVCLLIALVWHIEYVSH